MSWVSLAVLLASIAKLAYGSLHFFEQTNDYNNAQQSEKQLAHLCVCKVRIKLRNRLFWLFIHQQQQRQRPANASGWFEWVIDYLYMVRSRVATDWVSEWHLSISTSAHHLSRSSSAVFASIGPTSFRSRPMSFSMALSGVWDRQKCDPHKWIWTRLLYHLVRVVPSFSH